MARPGDHEVGCLFLLMIVGVTFVVGFISGGVFEVLTGGG